MNTIGLYIHIPFCEQKCPYCDFYSIADKNEHDRYVKCVLHTIQELSNEHKRIVSSIYFGGGTPSVIGTKNLVEIINEIKNCFKIDDNAEITVEVNPCSCDNLDFKVLRLTGFNRISIGLQSSDDVELNLLGRRHTAFDARTTVKKAKSAGFDNISLDLMLCVPNQTKSSLAESIKFCKDCDVQHISAYLLKIEPNTPYYLNKDKVDTFTDDEQASMYLFAVQELNKQGFTQYEISNFSKSGFEGKHNLKYWQCEEYLGIGPSAHSYIDGRRYFYPRNIEDFYDGVIIEDGIGGELEEYIMLNLRLKSGINTEILEKKYNVTLDKNFYQKANKLQTEGLIIINGKNISLTPEGCLVSNSVISYIIDII